MSDFYDEMAQATLDLIADPEIGGEISLVLYTGEAEDPEKPWRMTEAAPTTINTDAATGLALRGVILPAPRPVGEEDHTIYIAGSSITVELNENYVVARGTERYKILAHENLKPDGVTSLLWTLRAVKWPANFTE